LLSLFIGNRFQNQKEFLSKHCSQLRILDTSALTHTQSFKMASPNSILALNVHAYFYQHFETIAILWDQRKSRFAHISEKKLLLKWAVNTFLATILSNGFCIYLIVKEFISPQRLYPLEFLLVQLSLVVFAGFWIVVFFSSNMYGSNLVCVWNERRKMLLNVRKRTGSKLLTNCKFNAFLYAYT